MSDSKLVRASRDGDQFHYLWAARRCLQLLSPLSGVVAITIEGVSPFEASRGDRVEEGEELMDAAEYHGSQDLAHATLVRYMEFKHSTLKTADPWTPSGLEKTLRGFAQRYLALQQREIPIGKLEFWFISNRPVGSDFLETVDDVVSDAPTRHPTELKKLERFTTLRGSPLSSFCKMLRLECKQDGYWEQRNILTQEMSGYLPDADVDAPTQLKELVTRKALSENAENPTITKMDVLRVLRTDESRLFPAPCLIEQVEGVIPREQEMELIGSIVNAQQFPVIVHAAGGVGKSVFSTRIQQGLPEGSSSVLYDCFGNGQYRSASGYRHRHKDALVQIANELAGKGLCHPLIPTPNAEPSAYVRAFLGRLKQSITSLKAENVDALLCIIIDAADNAQIAAEEIGEARCFARDLLREQMPEGVRLIALCRTHRQALLYPPPTVLRLELRHFSRGETAAHLRRTFPNATEHDVDEFHRLSSYNPRVQALALSWKASLNEVLRKLGPNPTTVENAIGNLLNESIAKIRDTAAAFEKSQIDTICAGLAALRPLIPISVLASMSGVHEAAIRSFAFDLGRPLIVTDATIQFFDEPAETWFREQYKATAAHLTAFVDTLKPLASTSAYVAATLPQLMLEADQFPELVAMALSSEGLPDDNPLQRRDVELQRLQFALKASLRTKRYTDAAKLALKAGGESAGNERQRGLLQANTDLAAVFLETDRIQEIVSQRTFGSGWVGSHHAYEAGLMSGRSELAGDARSRLRMAEEWLRNWSLLSSEERQHEKITDADIVELAMAHFNIHGVVRCAGSLRGWRPRSVSFRAGRILARRFVDHGRYQDLDDLAAAAENDLCLILAITLELRQAHRNPPEEVVKRALRLVTNRRVKLSGSRGSDDEGFIPAVTALVEAGHRLSVRDPASMADVLTRILPPSPPRGLYSRFDRSRFPLLRAYSLRAALAHKPLELTDLAHPELRQELEIKNRHHDSEEARDFKVNIGALLPWYRLWADTFVGLSPKDGLAAAIADATSASSKATSGSYRDQSHLSNEIARIWLEIATECDDTETASTQSLNEWVESLPYPLNTPTLTQLARLASRTDSLKAHALAYADKAFRLARDEREDAETKVSAFISLARAILTTSRSGAAAYFDEAVRVASKVGDENLDRWAAMLVLADRGGNRNVPAPETAYKLARCAEVTYDYVADKHFDWEATVRALANLCPSSSLAILSRWRDRNFGSAERLLPAAINFLLEHQCLDPRAVLALSCFRASWDKVDLLNSTLSACGSKAEKETALTFLHRYMALDGQSAQTWRDLKNLLASHALVIPGIDDLIAFGERKEQSNKLEANAYKSSRLSPLESKEGPDWNSVFAGIDLSHANDISNAYGRFKSLGPPYYHDRFFREACGRVSVGKEAEFATAIADTAELDLYHFRSFLEQIPEEWASRLSVKSALACTLKIFCRRYCMGIAKDRYYEVLPFKTASALCGVSEGDVVDVVLSALGETTALFDAGRLFTLVDLLATKLSNKAALEALSFGLDLFEGGVEDRDGDGPWSMVLAPPADIEGAVAGYVWAGLAAPRRSLRWEAAHVVRRLCTLGRERVFGQLIALAKGSTGGPFADAQLHFYHLHARQWLLIALARAAKDNPEILVPYADFLIKFALSGEPHVLIRGFAAKSALTLTDSGLLDLQPDLRQRLQNVNVSPFPTVVSKSYERVYEQHSSITEGSDEDSFHFGIDIGPYWFAPLGNCFSTSQVEVERAARRVISIDWQYPGQNRRDDDERVRRGIFTDGETYHSHGSFPRTDDLRFYVSYHAMMVVAGTLLATVPSHHDRDDSENDFGKWLSRQGLSRADENWLADRRDPAPLEWPAWKDDVRTDNWRWSISRGDFDRLLLLPGGRMNLWGRWKTISGTQEESVDIGSALVSSDRSQALLRALQTATNPNDYRIPDADDYLQIDYDGFQLKGWIAERSDSGLDDHDPWAGAIRYPPMTPAQSVVDLMLLRSDSELRTWRVQGNHQGGDALWSQVWGQYLEKDDDTDQENGTRLQASFQFIVDFLRKMNMDLIVKVVIERRFGHSPYESRKDDDFGFIPASARLFLVRSDGSLCSI